MEVPRETLCGRVERITYKNRQNGYTVFSVSDGGKEVTAVGNFPFITAGDRLTLSGEYVTHPTYGRQFRAVSCERETPTTQTEIFRYLSSGAVRGIGPATAAKIIKQFGERALDVISDDPHLLCRIKGITCEKAEAISQNYKSQIGVQDLFLFLSRFKIGIETASNIYKTLGTKALDAIKANPYELCREEIGVSFSSADDIAASLKMPENDQNRIFAGIEYVLRHNLQNGHTCLPRKKLSAVSAQMLGCGVNETEEQIDNLLSAFRLRSKIIGKDEFLFLPQYYSSEEYIAGRLIAQLENCRALPLDELEIDFVENKLHIKYDEKQRTALSLAFERGVLLLTGGPGTGKTTTLCGLIELFEQKNLSVFLAAPTGRAAKRITELTNREAKTIHRLLEVQWGDADKQYFERNEKNPLSCDVMIIDETSMVDCLLFESLLRALRLGTRIILVGDANQLPSVSAGNVLHDIAESGKIPSVCLEKIFRQAAESLIVYNAHEIINGKDPVLDNKTSDFFMIDCMQPAAAAKTVVDLCCERLPKAYGFSPIDDIQVLCPSKKLDLGTAGLNALLQQRLNPADGSRSLKYGGFEYRENDKVIQIKNNYDILWERDDGEHGSGVYNGDIGKIERIDYRSELIIVRFDDKTATYYAGDLSQLEPAYAITVHKSQGSEFDCVILPLLLVPNQLLYRNLLYTAVTRAKRLLVIVGDRKTVSRMVENDRRTLRYSALGVMINEVCENRRIP